MNESTKEAKEIQAELEKMFEKTDDELIAVGCRLNLALLQLVKKGNKILNSAFEPNALKELKETVVEATVRVTRVSDRYHFEVEDRTSNIDDNCYHPDRTYFDDEGTIIFDGAGFGDKL